MHYRARTRRTGIGSFLGGVLIVCGAAPGTPALEIALDAADRPAATSAPEGTTAAVDWSALWLDEFAVGGPAVMACSTTTDATAKPRCECAKLQDWVAAAPAHRVASAARVSHEMPVSKFLDEQATPWNNDEVFEADAAPPEPVEQVARRPEARGEDSFAPVRDGWREGTTPAPRALAQPLRGEDAATEILKLRRAVGINPIAGTIFDSDSPECPAWAGDDRDENLLDAITSDDALAEAIRRLEGEEFDPRPAAPSEPAQDAEPAAAGGWHGHLLRPAEQALEEAAALLEQVGQFDRSDAARELARQVRAEARQHERALSAPLSAQRFPVWP